MSTGPSTDNSWVWQNPLPQGNNLYGLKFADVNTGWAVGLGGVVLKTTDAGSSWTHQDPGTTKDLYGVAFADASNGWVAGLTGTIRHTTNGGATWTAQSDGNTYNLRAVANLDANNAIAVGDKGVTYSTIAYTSNGGTSWALGTTPSTIQLNGVAISSANQAWAVGAGGTILRSASGGATWVAATSPTTMALNAIACARGTNIAYIVGAPNGTSTTILKTTDGTTWSALTPPAASLTLQAVACSADGSVVTVTSSTGSVYRSVDGGGTWATTKPALLGNVALRGVQMPDSSHVYVAGDYGTIATSANIGGTWATPAQGTTQNLLATYFVNSSTGWAVGAAGSVLKTTDGGASWFGKTVATGSLRGVMFINGTTGWIVGDAGTILKTTDGGATWNPQTSGVATQLNAVWFADANNGWAVGSSGVIRMTTNGGTTWTTSTSGTTQSLNAVWFADASNGFAVGNAGTIRKTVNGGTTAWTTSTSGTSLALYGVRGVSASTVWACGNTGTVLKTINGGTTAWTSLTAATGTTQPLYAIGFADANNGWVGGAYGTLRATTDGGTSWSGQKAGLSTVTSDSNVPVRAISVADANNVFLVGDTGVVRATGNGGSSWGSRQYPTVQQLNGIAFADANNGWLVGNASVVMRTTNAGRSWSIQKTGTTVNLFAVAAVDANTAYAVGASGAIRRTNDGGQTWTSQSSGTAVQLNAVASSGAINAVAGGAGGTMVYTADGGTTWATATLPTAQQINAVRMSTPSTGWAAANYIAGSPSLIRTLDGGRTWTAMTTTSTASFNGMYFLPDGATGWAVGSAGAIVKTTNGGNSWTVEPSGVTTVLYSVYFSDATHGWAVGASGVVLRTLNGGTSWAAQPSGTTGITFRGASFVDGNHGWILGSNGALLMTTDQTPPNTALSISPPAPNGTNGWYSSAPRMTLTPDEAATAYYSWVATAGPFTQYSAPVLAPEGAAPRFYYYAVDPNNNIEAVHSTSLKTDYTLPTTPVTVIAGTPTTSTVPLIWSAGIDSGSGVDHYDVFVGGIYSGSSTTTAAVVSGLSPYTYYAITVVSVDKAGLSSIPSTPVNITTKDMDRTALTTSLSAVPSIPDGSSGWYVSAPLVTLQSEPSTIPATIYYSWDTSAGPWSTYTTPVAGIEGQHTLWCYAHDNAGVRHDETPHQVLFKTDLSDPTTPASLEAGTPGTSTVDVDWSASSDPASGLRGYDVMLNGMLATATVGTSVNLSGLSPNTAYSVAIVAVDNAGRLSAPTAGVAFTTQDIDRTPLGTQRAVSPPLPDGLNGWYVTNPAVTLTSLPATASAITYYSWISESGPWSSYVATLSPSQAVETLWYYSHDIAEQRDDETPHAVTLLTDLDPPTQPSGLLAGTPTTSTAGLSWTASSDSASGVDHYDVLVNGTEQQSTTSTVTVLAGLAPNTSYAISVVAVDAAGRLSVPSSTVFVHTHDLDRTPLVTSAAPAPSNPDGHNGWYVTAPSIALASAPATVSATTYYSWSTVTGPWTAYSAAFVPDDGEHTLYFYSHDNSGSRDDEAAKSASYKIDTVDPTTPGSVSASDLTTSVALISWQASTDGASGVVGYLVKLDGVQVASPSSTSTAFTGLAENTTYAVSVASVDAAGRTSAWSAPVEFQTLAIDRTPLVTSANVTPVTPDGLNGWYTSAPGITLGSQPTTVTAMTYYSWDSSVGPWSTYLGDTLNPAEGMSTLWYRSNDIGAERNPEAAEHTDFKVDTLAPLPPDTVLAGAPDTSTIPVSWSGEIAGTSPIERYNVYVDGALRATATTDSIVLAGLAPATSHSIAVTAVSQSGLESDQSAPIFAVTLDVDHSPLVTTYAIAPNAPDGDDGWYVAPPTITLSSAPTTVSATTHYSWDTTAGPWLTYGGPFAPLNGDHTLYYYSHDISGARTDEAPQSAPIKFDPVVPVAPATLSTITVTHDSVKLSWSPVTPPPSGIARYEIWDEFIGSTTDTSYTVTGLKRQTTYPFSIIVVSGAGTRSSTSSTITVQTPNTLLPSTPTAVDANGSQGGTVTVDWSAASDVSGNAGYNVWRSLDGVTYSLVASTTGQFATSFADTGLRSSTRYWYAVSTFDDRGESAISDVSEPTWVYTAPVTGRPERVGGLSATEGSGSVLLTWLADTNPAVTGYLVTRSPKSMGAETTVTAEQVGIGPAPSFVDTSAVNGQTYYYTVYPVDASATVGLGSLEVEAKPHAAYTGADMHVVKRDLSSTACSACHASYHAPTGGGMMWAAGGTNEDSTCLRCHSVNSGGASSDTSSEVGDPLAQSSIPIWTPASTSSALTCGSCHRVLTVESSPTAGLVSVGGRGMSGVGGTNRGDAICYSCHGAGSTLKYGDMRGFESSAHANVADPASGSQLKCGACHESHASRNPRMTKYDGNMVCIQCHNSSTGPGSQDVWSKLESNDSPNSKHPLLPADQTSGARMSCQNCHNTHAVTSQYPLVDPHDPGPAGRWTGNLASDQKSFCFRCHDGQPLPTNSETRPWADAVLGENAATVATDIENAYNTNVHGFGVASDTTTATTYLRTDMGYMAGDTLDCSACHDSHGTPNDFGLVSQVKSATALTTVSGLLVYKIPAGTITPTSPVGYDLRFFCSSCHVFDPATHDPMAHTDTTRFGKTDCTSCHRHVSVGGSPSSGL